MSLKKFADTNFFLALMKETDLLKEKAIKIYRKNKENIWVSPFTIVEVMIVCKREKISLKETLIHISRIAKLEGVEWEMFFESADYVEKGSTIFDSLIMSICKKDSGNSIISSDKIYEKFGFKVIGL